MDKELPLTLEIDANQIYLQFFIEHKIGIYCRMMDATARVQSVVP